MHITSYNDKIVIKNITDKLHSNLNKLLSYTDQSKEYQLKKMEKSSWASAAAINALKNEMHQTLVTVLPNGDVEIPSGFHELLYKDDLIDVDARTETGGLNYDYTWRNEPFTLRDYQAEAVSAMLEHPKGLINLSTGMGKTLTTVHYIKQKGGKTLIVCPSTSIAKGFHEELVSAFGKDIVGFYGGGKKQIRDITVGIAQSVTRNVQKFVDYEFKTVVFDETHRVAAATFVKIANGLAGVERVYGLTATRYRSDGKDILIESAVGKPIIVRDTVWGVKNGWLAEPHFYVRHIDTVAKDYPGDKLKNYKGHVLKSTIMNVQITADINNLIAKGLSTLVLVSEVEHGEFLSEQTGLPFAHGKNKENDKLLKQLNSGEIGGLIATGGLMGEGTDTKRVDALVLATFVAAKGKVIQQVGRGLRKYGDKEKVVIFDYCPLGSKMLTRHTKSRIKFYREFTDHVTIVK